MITWMLFLPIKKTENSEYNKVQNPNEETPNLNIDKEPLILETVELTEETPKPPAVSTSGSKRYTCFKYIR